MLLDPSIIDVKIVASRERDQACTARMLNEIARLVATDQYNTDNRVFSLDTLSTTIRPARYLESGNPSPGTPIYPLPENGSYAYQLWSAICFMVDARVELKLLELIASPDFYSALMRSAAEIPDAS